MAGQQSTPTHRPPRVSLRTARNLVVGATVVGLATGAAQIAAAGSASAPRSASMVAGASIADGTGSPGPEAADVTEGTKAFPSEEHGKSRKSGRPGKSGKSEPAARGGVAGEARREKTRPTAEDVIRLAKKQVGIAEDSDGETKFGKWYVGTDRAKETIARDGGGTPEIYGDAAWCSMFISWLGDQLDFTDQMGSDAWTVEHARWFQTRGRWGTEPRPGAIAFFAWGGGEVDDIEHVGMVVQNKGDGMVETVEGNSENAVRVQERSTDDIAGYGYPEYAEED